MRYNQFKAFEKHLDAASSMNFSALYCLISKNAAERYFAFSILKEKVSKQCVDLDIKTYEADAKSEQKFLNDYATPSLFTKKQLLHFSFHEKLSKKISEALEKQFDDLSSQTLIVLSGETLVRSSAFYKKLEKHGIILDIGEEKPWEKEKALAEWLTMRAMQTQQILTPEALSVLTRGVGGSFALLANEWEKIQSYVDGRKTITLKDVEAVSVLTPADNTWQLGEALLQKDFPKAFEAAKQALTQGHAVLSLIRQIRYQFMQSLHLVSYSELGQMEFIAAKYPYLKGILLEKQLTCAKLWGRDILAKSIAILDGMEFKFKDGWDHPETLMTVLIAKLALEVL